MNYIEYIDDYKKGLLDESDMLLFEKELQEK